MAYVVAVDQGTTGSTVLVFDRLGRVVGRAYSEFTQHYPRPGWVEHDAEEIWQVTLRVLRQACRRAGARGRDIRALGITNQRETTVLWSRRTGRPVHRAIVWQDRRTAPLCEELRARGLEARVRQKTGLVLDPYFSGTKLRWLLENVARAAERAAEGELCFGTIDSWLVWKLSGGAVHATDPTNASRTLLYDIHARAWDGEMCTLLDVPTAVLPVVRPSSGGFGTTTPDVLGAPIPIAGIAGDQQAALFGQGCVEPGMAKNTYGTGC
ncbi:MAG: glycerol kinase, partial [Deltaproteobacteria bacterium]